MTLDPVPDALIEPRPVVAPLLRWAGGKQWLAAKAHVLSPPKYKRYFEPFLGGASFFFALRAEDAWLSDNNPELIATYRAIARAPGNVVRCLRVLPHTKRAYYRIRRDTPSGLPERAARFIYLNRTAWNGLYRVNQEGEFNVPYGTRRPIMSQAEALIHGAAPALRGAHLRALDFERALSGVKRSDFVYLDPPYVSTHRKNGFLRYNAKVFSWDDQERLQRCVERLDKAGAHVLMSNADHSSIVRLYKGFYQRRVNRPSRVAGDIDDRKDVTEILISNYPLVRP